MQDLLLKQIASKMNISTTSLIKYFLAIGIYKEKNSFITHQEKSQLLLYLNNNKIKYQHTMLAQKMIKNTLNNSNQNIKEKNIIVEFKNTNIYDTVKKNKQKEKKCNLKVKKIVYKQKHMLNQNSSNKNLLYKVKKIRNSGQTTVHLKKNFFNDYKGKNLGINKLKKHSYDSNKKHKTIMKKLFVSSSKDTKMTLKSNKLLQHKKSYSLPLKPIDHVTDYYSNYNHNNKNKITKSINLSKKNNMLKKEITKNLLKSSNHVQHHNEKNIKFNYLQQTFNKPKKIINRNITLRKDIIVYELANKMAIKVSELIKKMAFLGIIVAKNQIIDCETAELVAREIGHKVFIQKENELEELIMQDRNVGRNTVKNRPPVVTVMGHVDHGKTSLLDCIRSTKIVSKEFGGITQHIGAYHIKVNNNIITFIDTPGHAAFTAMRLRGAQITDIILLIVAADDGVKPQTIEAIKHAKVTKVPIIVVISKIDKIEKDNLDKIKNELSKYDILSEEWGGQNIFVKVSAKKNIGIKNLLDTILLQSEMLELKTIYNGMAKGIVIESYLDKGRGPIATVLVQEGILNKGDIIISGLEYGKIRAIRNEDGKTILNVGPSIPVEILGLSGIPMLGEPFVVVKNEKKARELALNRQSKFRENKLFKKKKLKLENLFESMKKDSIIQLKIVLKVDVQGSLEAISDSLYKISTKQVQINIVNSGVGSITETDASLAAATNAIIIGFNVRADVAAKKIIEFENLDLRYYSIIYELLDEVKKAMDGLLVPKYKQQIIGLAEVRNVFKSPRFNSVAGCMIIEGIIKRNNPIRIIRNDVVIYEGELESLRRFKEDVNELRNGMECGIGVKNYNDIRVGDKIEVFKNVSVKQLN